MSIDSEIPYDFKARIFPDYVRIATANGIIGAQYVERVLNAICLILQTEGLRFSAEDFMSGDSFRTKQTLGLIGRQLRNAEIFDSSFSQRLTVFTQRRNRVVHGLFADTFKSSGDIDCESQVALGYVRECEWLAKEGAELVEVGFGIFRVLGNTLLKANPDDSHLHALIESFDEFREVGMDALSPQFRPHFKSLEP